jgi:catechol 2,3-dioxygenase-like lactoylglutathione lyase family enzyme
LQKGAVRNDAREKSRLRASTRLTAGPANVVRLGHAVLGVKDFRASEAWYKSHFGFITSDEIEAAPGFAIGAFLRCDRGATPTDHHTLFLLQGPGGAAFNHAAFEVVDFDDLMCGHTHLKQAKRAPAWGVGRHILGSQIFDYWKDPWGHELEHWTDGDLFTADDGSNTVALKELLAVQWGPNHPMMGG